MTTPTTPQNPNPEITNRSSLVSQVLLEPIPAAAKDAVLIDDQNRRLVLVELKVKPGTNVNSVRRRFGQLFDRLFPDASGDRVPVSIGRHYVRCLLDPDEVRRLVLGGGDSGSDAERTALNLIYRVWPDLVVKAHMDRSVTTIQADAAARTYGCSGTGVVWAVIDSGIDASHPHFAANHTLTAECVKGLHRDFTIAVPSEDATPGEAGGALTDTYGHGTHVAGIIAGQAPKEPPPLIATTERTLDEWPRLTTRCLGPGTTLSGVAPQANLVSLKVLDAKGNTMESAVIDALDYVRTVNDGGRDLQIHGVNLSLGCAWQPRDYAAGQSPLCREIDLLVGSGVVAVVSAGNSGAGTASGGLDADIVGAVSDVYGQLSTVTDPGNAAGAITVGSTHRYRPHTYGVTFNSSKGPTLDGRMKPDLVAPGERITSAAAGQQATRVESLATGNDGAARYVELDGTSMAAAHVSGAIAAFLSARSEFIGQPQLVKKQFTDTATDLGRHQFFQGAGLVNLMRALTNT